MKFRAFIFILLPLFLNAVMLLDEYTDQNLSGWYMSEKLDGVRGIWDAKELKSRSGYKFSYPDEFIKCFPSEALDGELFTKRGDFENISSITSKMNPHSGWREIKFYIFDMPKVDANFSVKYKKMINIAKNCENIEVIEQIVAKDSDEVFDFLDEVVKKGGEGVVVRSPDLIYENKRSDKILKIKKFKDAECEVVGINEGNGKYKGMMGSLTCRDLKSKEVFKIGSGFNDEMRKNPPKIGDLITYKYQSLTSAGKPRFPVFLRIRDEL